MKELLRFLVGLLAPFVLVFGGGWVVGIGLEYEFNVLVWAGGITVLSGLLWGGWILLLHGPMSWWD